MPARLFQILEDVDSFCSGKNQSSEHLAPTIAPLTDAALSTQLRRLLDGKTKPLGALGRLEDVALQLGMILGTPQPTLKSPRMFVFAADHGLAVQGVSAYPQTVTAQMVLNMLGGGAAVNVLTRQHGIELTLVDAGVLHPLPPHPGLISCRIGPGTSDASVAPAMSMHQCLQAIAAGRELVSAHDGNLLMLGEMGIGNTSSASLLTTSLTDIPLSACVGRGTGLDDAALARKSEVLRRTLTTHQGVSEPLAVLAAMGGFEIAMMVGAILEAAHRRKVVLVDGFIVSAALLVAYRLAPEVLGYCVFSHRSAETGHARMLDWLGVKPLLDLDLRLGEGSGAALAWPLIDSAARLLCEMSSFESAGVSGRIT